MNSDTARPALHLPARYLAIVQDILRRYLPHAEVWAYGSRVNGDHYDASDLDLVVRQPDDLSRRQPDLDEVAGAFSDSDLPILVQIVDWARIPAAFREEIEAEYVVLQSTDGGPIALPREEADAGVNSDGADGLPSSAWESGQGSSASRAEVPKQSLGTKKIHVGDLLNETGGDIQTGPFGTKLKAAQYTPDGVPVISVGEVGYGRLRTHPKTPRVNETITRSMPEYLLEPGDIVFGRKGAVDRSALVLEDQRGWFLGSDGIRLRLPSSCDAGFISYQLQAHTHREWMIRHAAGTTMASLNESIIRRIPILLPSLSAQRAIAGVLGALDDKIEQNRRTAQALERLARAIFRAWFVDFEPVKAKAAGATSFPSMPQPVFDALPPRFVDSEIGPVPEGWDLGMLADYCKINDRTIRKGEISGEIEYIDIASVTVGRLDCIQRLVFDEAPSRARRRVRHGDTIWSCVRPNRRSFLFIHSPMDNCIVSTGFAVLSPINFGPSYLYQLVTRPEFVEYLIGNADGSAYPAVRPEHFATARALVPTPNALEAFESFTMPGRDLIASLERESRKLSEFRDYLLPKLLSGTVRINDAERLLEAAQ
ncbi:restriction endonuclease subunit S [Thiocapsa rosea]|uniref:Type I restriction enzyme S subunit n=1 Tax=Thiocapsa rosea TaxID=69360 RepID=A0A495V5X1_9GAMM|nr:restriction endonuclease subunit S [Thiocapsa rosea]RKT44719.1 type I restriction enzyme S subunit [Thiocapsa rosea]